MADESICLSLPPEEQAELDRRVIAAGAPFMELPEFVGLVVGKKAFFHLVEAGLPVYDKKISNPQQVSAPELLRCLHNPENNDEAGIMWGSLANVRHYTVFQDDVAAAYRRAKHKKFPWLALPWPTEEKKLVWLDIEEHQAAAIGEGETGKTPEETPPIHTPAVPRDEGVIKKSKRGKTKINIFLREIWDSFQKPEPEQFVRKLKQFEGSPNSPIKKYHGWHDEVCIEWNRGCGSKQGSWGKKAFQNKVNQFKQEDTKSNDK